MINPGYTSIENLIEQIYIESGYTEIPWNEALAHIERIVGLLGIPAFYITRITDGNTGNAEPIRIENYRGILPSDLIYPMLCREYENKIPMYYSTDGFFLNQNTVTQEPTSFSNTDWTEFQGIGQSDLDTDSARFYNFLTQYEQEVYSGLSEKYKSNSIASVNLTYTFNNNYIFTSFEEGWVEMTYKAFPIDGRGLPLIPDDETIKRAIEAYIISMIDNREWRVDPTNQGKKAIKQDSETKAAIAIRRVHSYAKLPDVAEMEAIKNMWLRLNPKINEYATGFKFNTLQEQLRFTKER